MSDSDKEQDGLISQEDIDSLLDSSSIEDAESRLDENAGADEALEEAGELSQADIDSLLNGGDDESGSTDDIADDFEEADGELSQADIDRMLGGGNDTPDDEDAGDEEDIELISQEDINQLMNPGTDDAAPDTDPDPDPESEPPDDEDELISMDDIQGMLDQDDDDDNAAVDAVDDTAEREPAVSAATPDQEEPGENDTLDSVIDDGQGAEVADCLITQDTMDRLIADAGELSGTPADETGMAGDNDEPEPGRSDLDDLVQDDFDTDDPDLKDLDVDDLDDALAAEDKDADFGGDDSSDVTQADIDALLNESDDDFLDDDDDILISQDDIDTLLMAADQEDEDVLGDLMGDDAGFEMDEDLDMEDLLGDDAGGAEDNAGDADQVVLEGAEGDAPPAKKKSGKKIIGLFRSKIFWVAASVVLVLMICVPAGYFLFFSSKEHALPENQVVASDDLYPGGELEVTTVTVEDPDDMAVARKPGTMVLSDFVILASDTSKEMTYVYADIAIDYSDQRAYHEINNNLSFYRDLIYGSIKDGLVSEKRDEVTKADLLWALENAFKKVLPPHYISRISFKTFKTT